MGGGSDGPEQKTHPTWGGLEDPAALVFGASRPFPPRPDRRRDPRRKKHSRGLLFLRVWAPVGTLAVPNPSPDLPAPRNSIPTDCDGTLVDTMGGFYVADKKTCEEFDMTMSKQQFYDLAGVPIRRIFEILAQEQGKTPDLDAMAARCKVRKEERVTRVPPARIETPGDRVTSRVTSRFADEEYSIEYPHSPRLLTPNS